MFPFINLLFPPHCVFCDAELKYNARRMICAQCDEKLLNYSITQITTHENSTFTLACVAALRYSDIVRDAVLRMKFNNAKIWLCPTLGELLANAITRQLIEEEHAGFDVVCYVPISSKRMIERKFNQAEELSIIVSRTIGIPLIKNAIIKKRETVRHSLLTGAERLNNVKGAYEVRKSDSVNGKTVLLIDDVVTTGSTLKECSDMLYSAGVKSVYCAALAAAEFDNDTPINM